MERHSANITKALEDVAAVQDDVAEVQGDVAAVQEDVKRNSAVITTSARRGTWCGKQVSWRTVGTITYDSITYSDFNNMSIAAPPLDINTGMYINN